jgi:hypothetical protein
MTLDNVSPRRSRHDPTSSVPSRARSRRRRRPARLARRRVGLLACALIAALAGLIGGGLRGAGAAGALALGPAGAVPAGAGACEPAPSWLAGATPPARDRGPLSACFARSSEAEAPLQLANGGPRALLITVSGPVVALDEYWFSGRVDAALASGLAQPGGGAGAGSGTGEQGEQVIVLGPHRRATLTIGRPPPAPATQAIRIVAAHGVAETLAGLAWQFMHDARQLAPVPAAVQSCATATLRRASSPAGVGRDQLALMRACVARAAAHAGRAARRVRALASSLLSERAFERVADSAGGEARAAPIVLSVAGSAPGPINPQIHIAIPSLGTVVDGARTIVRLHASGGRAPYRFYIWREPGAAPVPSWVRLAPRGTLTIAPPTGASLHVQLTIYAIDAEGYFSQDLP